ncbi:hypothetical protein C8R48DRAFT_676563 [Suillus tomentosus]|nr:hypothetical protein C8R48DRAFT_676563 [Suillus tomentosus]
MSPSNRVAAANQSFRDLSDKIEHILGQACQLQPADAKHLSLATTMGQAITEVVMTHGSWVTVLSPLILSAAAELQEHLDGDNTGISTPPVWSQIRGDDRRIQGHPLFPATVHYRGESRSPSPKAGPSQPPSLPAEERGRGTQRGKRPRASSACSRSRPAISKKQCSKSRATIDTDDELDEDELAPPPNKPTVVDPPARKSGRYVEVASEEEMDADEEPAIQIKPTVIVKKITTNFSGAVLTEDEFADTSAPTWAPRCGQCVARDLMCRQGINKNNGRTLKVYLLRWERLQSSPSQRQVLGWPLSAFPVPAPPFADSSLEDPAPDAGPLVEEEPAPSATLAVANPESSQTLDDPVAAGPSSILAPSCVAHDQELQALKMEVTALRATVEALMGQVVAGDQLLQAAYMRLDAQDNRTDLLAGKIADIHRLVDPPSSVTPTDIAADECPDLAAGPAQEMEDSACLPVTIKTPEVEDSNVSGEPAM